MGRLTPCRKPHLRTPQLPLKVDLTTVRSGQPGSPPKWESMAGGRGGCGTGPASLRPEPCAVLRLGHSGWETLPGPGTPGQLLDRRDGAGVLPPPPTTASAPWGAAPRWQAGGEQIPPGSTQLPPPPVARGPEDTLQS